MKDFRIPASDFRTLLEMVVLARTLADSHQGEGRGEWLNAFHHLAQNVLQAADQYDCGELITTAPEGHLIPAPDYDANSFYGECIDAHADHIFWEDLVARLTDRDLARSCPPDEWEMLPAAEQERRRRERDEFYWREFEKHGIDRLEFIPREPHG